MTQKSLNNHQVSLSPSCIIIHYAPCGKISPKKQPMTGCGSIQREGEGGGYGDELRRVMLASGLSGLISEPTQLPRQYSSRTYVDALAAFSFSHPPLRQAPCCHHSNHPYTKMTFTCQWLYCTLHLSIWQKHLSLRRQTSPSAAALSTKYCTNM